MNIHYDIVRSNRKTIAIQIKPNGSVIVRCPNRMKKTDIEHFVASKESWIRDHLPIAAAYNLPPFTTDELEQMKMKTKSLVGERAAYYAAVMGVSFHRITVRAQRTRWGSCSSNGNLNFNCMLALVPMEVLDYVVVHELCHLKHMDHSVTFWQAVGHVLPDYARSRKWLRTEGKLLISRIPE